MSTTPVDPDAPEDPDDGEPRDAPPAAVPSNRFILIVLNVSAAGYLPICPPHAAYRERSAVDHATANLDG